MDCNSLAQQPSKGAMELLSWQGKIVLVALVVHIAMDDARYRRVSNASSVAVLALAAAIWLQLAGAEGLGQWTGGLLVAGSMLLWPYARGWVGAADVKVFAAYGALVGLNRVSTLATASIFAAGALSAVYLLAWYTSSPKLLVSSMLRLEGALARGRRSGRTLPLAVALGAGLVVTLGPDRAWAL